MVEARGPHATLPACPLAPQRCRPAGGRFPWSQHSAAQYEQSGQTGFLGVFDLIDPGLLIQDESRMNPGFERTGLASCFFSAESISVRDPAVKSVHAPSVNPRAETDAGVLTPDLNSPASM